MFENPRRGRQARNFTTNVPKILDLKSSSEQIFSRKLSLGAPVTRRLNTFWDNCTHQVVILEKFKDNWMPSLSIFMAHLKLKQGRMH